MYHDVNYRTGWSICTSRTSDETYDQTDHPGPFGTGDVWVLNISPRFPKPLSPPRQRLLIPFSLGLVLIGYEVPKLDSGSDQAVQRLPVSYLPLPLLTRSSFATSSSCWTSGSTTPPGWKLGPLLGSWAIPGEMTLCCHLPGE
jgi:hypothetical protein